LIPRLGKALKDQEYDLCWVDAGRWVTPKVIKLLRQHAQKIVSYSIDDPLGPRDGRRFKAYRQSLSCYDLCVVMRAQNVVEAKALGAKNVMRVFMTADEITHAPRSLTEEDYKQWSSEVLFVGTWMPERGSFLLKLIKLGVPLSIRGSSWHRSPEWHELKKYWKPAVYGDDYAKAIQCAKISLGLLSKGNRDLHTTRSSEIPSFGGLLCSERTSEHSEMYEEGREALFWSDAADCASICKLTLADEDGRQAIAKAGSERVRRNGHFNEVMLNKIILTVAKLDGV
jgi:spore maturation protein CgeB